MRPSLLAGQAPWRWAAAWSTSTGRNIGRARHVPTTFAQADRSTCGGCWSPLSRLNQLVERSLERYAMRGKNRRTVIVLLSTVVFVASCSSSSASIGTVSADVPGGCLDRDPGSDRDADGDLIPDGHRHRPTARDSGLVDDAEQDPRGHGRGDRRRWCPGSLAAAGQRRLVPSTIRCCPSGHRCTSSTARSLPPTTPGTRSSRLRREPSTAAGSPPQADRANHGSPQGTSPVHPCRPTSTA